LKLFYKLNILLLLCSFHNGKGEESIARKWNEALLHSIRHDLARPTVHARNLFHISAAMYDAWAIFDDSAQTYLIGNEELAFNTDFEGFAILPSKQTEDVEEAISFAAYRLIKHRFANSPGWDAISEHVDSLMDALGYDRQHTSMLYKYSAAALGNYIAAQYINYGLEDGSNEIYDYENNHYIESNVAINPTIAGNPSIEYPNLWQPIQFELFIDQAGNQLDLDIPDFLSPEWGNVTPFALQETDQSIFSKGEESYIVYHDPGDPVYIYPDENATSSEAYQWGFSLVSKWSSHLDTSDAVLWDISPNTIGNIAAYPEDNLAAYQAFYDEDNGGDNSQGYTLNPVTQEAYETQMVSRGDYTRVLAEFWADGPDSETPPGHWFTILNEVSDHALLQKQFEGQGDVLSDLEWDIKAYFLLGGAMHDAAISAWSIKGYYDYIRPISAIRYLAKRGQSSDDTKDNYHFSGIPLTDGLIELVEEGDDLAGDDDENVGKIKLYTWRGPDYIDDEATDMAGVGWILAENWWPYQRPSFVTPPFAGYVSGHSTFSRAASVILEKLTASPYFPGGLGEFVAKQNEFLVFEEGPSTDIKLQWVSYKDAADQCSLSRIWGGIHPPIDDIPGRKIGEKVGEDSFDFGKQYFAGGSKLQYNASQAVELAANFIPKGEPLLLGFSSEDVAYEIGIYTSTGKTIFHETVQNTLVESVSTVSFERGMYMIHVSSSLGTTQFKCVVY